MSGPVASTSSNGHSETVQAHEETSLPSVDVEERPRKRQRDAPDESPSGVTPYEPSYFGIAPHDEFVREVGTWIWQWSRGLQHVEIEAKIGLLLESHVRNQKVRLDFPVATECSKLFAWFELFLLSSGTLA